MSDKDRQKKDGADKNKKNQRMHEANSGGTVKENDPNKRQGAAESDVKKIKQILRQNRKNSRLIRQSAVFLFAET